MVILTALAPPYRGLHAIPVSSAEVETEGGHPPGARYSSRPAVDQMTNLNVAGLRIELRGATDLQSALGSGLPRHVSTLPSLGRFTGGMARA